jgi:hypothetical protein
MLEGTAGVGVMAVVALPSLGPSSLGTARLQPSTDVRPHVRAGAAAIEDAEVVSVESR